MPEPAWGAALAHSRISCDLCDTGPLPAIVHSCSTCTIDHDSHAIFQVTLSNILILDLSGEWGLRCDQMTLGNSMGFLPTHSDWSLIYNLFLNYCQIPTGSLIVAKT